MTHLTRQTVVLQLALSRTPRHPISLAPVSILRRPS